MKRPDYQTERGNDHYDLLLLERRDEVMSGIMYTVLDTECKGHLIKKIRIVMGFSVQVCNEDKKLTSLFPKSLIFGQVKRVDLSLSQS